MECKLADIGEGISEVEVISWHVHKGSRVSEFDPLCSVQSDKATVEITSQYTGTVKELIGKEGQLAKVGSTLVVIDTDEAEEEASPSLSNPDADSDSKPVLTTPAVRRIAKENNLDLNKVLGTGREGRILKEDVLKLVNGDEPNITMKEDKEEEEDIVVSLTNVQKKMFRTMTDSLSIPHFNFMDVYDANELLNLSKDKKSFLPYLIKMISSSLTLFPSLNSHLLSETQHLLKKDHNFGIAMDTDRGLLVPVLKKCQNKSIEEISEELKSFVVKKKEGKGFKPSDFSDPTFTLSNIGSVGRGTYMSPIITRPQVCVLAIGRAWEEGEKRKINFSFAADHRVVDGATLSRFSNDLRTKVENPSLLLTTLR